MTSHSYEWLSLPVPPGSFRTLVHPSHDAHPQIPTGETLTGSMARPIPKKMGKMQLPMEFPGYSAESLMFFVDGLLVVILKIFCGDDPI